MNKEDEDNLLKWLKDKDVSEVMDLRDTVIGIVEGF